MNKKNITEIIFDVPDPYKKAMEVAADVCRVRYEYHIFRDKLMKVASQYWMVTPIPLGMKSKFVEFNIKLVKDIRPFPDGLYRNINRFWLDKLVVFGPPNVYQQLKKQQKRLTKLRIKLEKLLFEYNQWVIYFADIVKKDVANNSKIAEENILNSPLKELLDREKELT